MAVQALGCGVVCGRNIVAWWESSSYQNVTIVGTQTSEFFVTQFRAHFALLPMLPWQIYQTQSLERYYSEQSGERECPDLFVRVATTSDLKLIAVLVLRCRVRPD